MNYDIAAGSVQGREHARAGRNNQDAFAIRTHRETLAAIVCDGCGSAPHSEVGAQIISRWLATFLADREWSPQSARENLAVAQALLVEQLKALADSMGDRRRVARDYFLATIVGAVVTDSVVVVFSLGDGVILHNDRKLTLTFPGNAPPYLAHALMGEPAVPFSIHTLGSAKSLNHLVLASDGAGEIERQADDSLPGKDIPMGDLQQFVRDDTYFQNPTAILRRLRLMNRCAKDPEAGFRIPGRLGDDTTIVTIRRKASPATPCAPTCQEKAIA